MAKLSKNQLLRVRSRLKQSSFWKIARASRRKKEDRKETLVSLAPVSSEEVKQIIQLGSDDCCQIPETLGSCFEDEFSKLTDHQQRLLIDITLRATQYNQRHVAQEGVQLIGPIQVDHNNN